MHAFGDGLSFVREPRRARGLNPKNLEAFAHFGGRRKRSEPHRVLVRENQQAEDVFFLRRGWAAAHRVTADGRHQTLSFFLPGDFIDAGNLFGRETLFTVESLTDVEIWPIRTSEIISLMSSKNDISSAVLAMIARDRAITAERMIDLGRRSALERTAHFLLETLHRIRTISSEDADGFDFPPNQQMLADALGLTPVHLNRVVRSLREARLISWRGAHVTILDERELAAVASFDPDYLR